MLLLFLGGFGFWMCSCVCFWSRCWISISVYLPLKKFTKAFSPIVLSVCSVYSVYLYKLYAVYEEDIGKQYCSSIQNGTHIIQHNTTPNTRLMCINLHGVCGCLCLCLGSHSKAISFQCARVWVCVCIRAS